MSEERKDGESGDGEGAGSHATLSNTVYYDHHGPQCMCERCRSVGIGTVLVRVLLCCRNANLKICGSRVV